MMYAYFQDARRIQRASPTPIHTTTSPSQQALIWQKSLIGTAVAKVDTDKTSTPKQSQ